jgi:hypothetical protein
MDIDNKPVKNSNVWSSIVNIDQESDTDSELKHDDEPDNDYCRSIRVDGHPCQALRYKNELYCYSHLMSQKTRPRGRPKKSVAAPASLAERRDLGALSAIAVSDAQVAPVGLSVNAQCEHRALNDDLIVKLTNRLKIKIDAIDTETKILLKLLL